MEQLEWLTGGECAAGMHEVVVSENTLQAIDASQKAGKSLWRVSSTVSSFALDTLFYCSVPSVYVKCFFEVSGAESNEPVDFFI